MDKSDILLAQSDEFGEATNGSNSLLCDREKNWPIDFFTLSLLTVWIDGTAYKTIISGNDSQNLNFAVLPVQVQAGSPYIIKNIRQNHYSQNRPGANFASNQFPGILSYTASSILSPYPWWTLPLGAGNTAYCVNVENGSSHPAIIVPAGYTGTLLELIYSFTEATELVLYIDTLPVAILGEVSAHSYVNSSQILAITTKTLDPQALSGHVVDLTVKNNGANAMVGGLELDYILEKVA